MKEVVTIDVHLCIVLALDAMYYAQMIEQSNLKPLN